MHQHDHKEEPILSPNESAKDSCCSNTTCHVPVAAMIVILKKIESHAHTDCCTHDHGSTTETRPNPVDASAGTHSVRYRILNMDCPTEERLIRNKLEAISGIRRLDFNLLERELTVHHQHDDDGLIIKALKAIDMMPQPLDSGTNLPLAAPALAVKKKILLAASGIFAMAAELIAWLTDQENSWYIILIACLSIISIGLPILKKGWLAISNFTLNIYFLMSLAVVGAMIIGKWPEAAMVIFLFAVAEAIEALSLERARYAINSLTALAPDTAEVQHDGVWKAIPIAQVASGSLIRVRTGTRVPLDARVSFGTASLNQAPITGESLPVDKQIGDPLYAGSIVTDGVVEAIVTAPAGESTLARIANAIQEAQSQRAATQRFVDQFARYYTPAVVILAVAIALIGPLLSGGSWYSWLYEALILLVIACPCALVISTPITVVSGLAAAAKHGILIKGGAYLEKGRLLKAIALDKTGTLTQGNPVLTDAIALTAMPIEEALLIAASLDENSTHPVAKALVNGWRSRQPMDKMLSVANFSVLSGYGVRGYIEEQEWYLGNHSLVEQLGICTTALEAQLSALENIGKTCIALCSKTHCVAVFGVADTIKSESIQAIAALKKLNVYPVMLTGDNTATAHTIADQIGIQDARGELLPDDKKNAIAGLINQYGIVGMVGDGINDAPALALADIGFGMGAAGTATALETSDVAIMNDDLRRIPLFIRLSHQTARILKQNIIFALGIKAIFLGLAFSGHATLWMAVFADMGASLLVVLNGLRLLKWNL